MCTRRATAQQHVANLAAVSSIFFLCTPLVKLYTNAFTQYWRSAVCLIGSAKLISRQLLEKPVGSGLVCASLHACGQHGSQALLGVAGRRSMTRGQGAARPRVTRGCARPIALAALLLLLGGVAPSPAPSPRTPPPAGPSSSYWHPDSAPQFPPRMHLSCMSCMQGACAHLCQSVGQLRMTSDSFFSTFLHHARSWATP